MTDYKGGLARKLAEVTAATNWIEKRGTAPDNIGGYQYAMAVDIYASVRKQLSERKVASTVGINDVEHDRFEKNGKMAILTTVKGDLSFIDGESGEVISVPFAGVGIDNGDKSIYKAITGGVRDALKANFLLPTGDDPEATDGGVGDEKPKSEPKPVTTGPTPPKAEQVKTEKVGLSNPQKAKLAVVLREHKIESNDQRHMFLMTAVGKHSTSQMTGTDLDKALAEAAKPDSLAVTNAQAVV